MAQESGKRLLSLPFPGFTARQWFQVTGCKAVWTFCGETRYPLRPRKFNKLIVQFSQCSFSLLAISKSSTNCSSTPFPGGCSHCSRSFASWFPRRVGLFLNPWEGTVHVSYVFLPESEFFHSNAKIDWLRQGTGVPWIWLIQICWIWRRPSDPTR